MARKEITIGQLNTDGYSGDKLAWNGKDLSWGEAIIPMKEGCLDLVPEGIAEVRVLNPTDSRDEWLNAAVITGETLQEFGEDGTIMFVEEPIKGHGIAIGITPEGESYTYNSDGVCSIKTRQFGGSWLYGPGYVHGWIRMSLEALQYAELCMGKYVDDGTIRVMSENEPVIAPMFWGLWRMLKNEQVESQANIARD